jgi:hypothetical protein
MMPPNPPADVSCVNYIITENKTIVFPFGSRDLVDRFLRSHLKLETTPRINL